MLRRLQNKIKNGNLPALDLCLSLSLFVLMDSTSTSFLVMFGD